MRQPVEGGAFTPYPNLPPLQGERGHWALSPRCGLSTDQIFSIW